MKKLILCCLLLTPLAFAQINGNLFPGWTVTATNNAFVANTTFLTFYPGTTSLQPNTNLIYPRFQLTFTAPGTYVVGALSLWKLANSAPFLIGVPIATTYLPKIAGKTCIPTSTCSITVPGGTTLNNPFVFETDPFQDVAVDVNHNWVLGVYFASNTSSGAAVAQGLGSEVTGALNAATGNQVTGETSLPLGRDGSNRIMLVTGVQFN